MYLNFFGFDEPPFSITPDPRFVFLSEKHQESLAHLVYGITRGGGAGFVQLTGEVGTGKTTICRLLLEQIPAQTNIALILNPQITPVELLQYICTELKIPMRGIKGKLNSLVDKLNTYLLNAWSAGENTVVIIDEAQNLGRDTLEQLRLLTNLETDKQKLLQIVLIGQPELRSTMRRNDLRQLAQRITARYHLMPLSTDETFTYLKHRIGIAAGNPEIVSTAIAKQAHRLTQGIPRLLNVLMDRALLAAYSDDVKKISGKHLSIAATEVLPDNYKPTALNTHWKASAGIITLLSVLVLGLIGVLALDYFKPTNRQNHTQTTRQNTQQKSFVPASTELAWQHYYQLWDTDFPLAWNKAACPSSQDTGMDCLRRQGNLMQIEKLNHPVMLGQIDGSLLLLTGINADKIALLNHSAETEFVDKQWLEKNWLGTYFIIWPMPAELLLTDNPIKLQQWSLKMANNISKNPIQADNLENWIIGFQNNNGLIADGIIGSETQMALSLNAYNGPTLN